MQGAAMTDAHPPARLLQDRGQTELQELLAAYAEYVKLLAASERTLIGFAYTHGYQIPEELVQRGRELRRLIAELRTAADLDAPPPQSKLFRRGIEEGEFEE